MVVRRRMLMMLHQLSAHAMVSMCAQNGPISALAVFDEFRDARHGCGTRAGVEGNLAIRKTLRKLFCNFKPLTQGLKLRKSRDITKEIFELLI